MSSLQRSYCVETFVLLTEVKYRPEGGVLAVALWLLVEGFE